MVSSSSDCERESSPAGVKNFEENEGNFKDISHSLLGVDARAHTHTHIYNKREFYQLYRDDSRRTRRRGERDLPLPS